MECTSCLIHELRFEFHLAGEPNKTILPDVIQYLSRSKALVKREADRLTIRESGVRDFLDFSQAHMDPSNITFRIEKQAWRPLTEAADILDMQWIDEVILNESIQCYFQPIVTADQTPYAYESLARFTSEDGSLLYPQEVFAAAKNRGRLFALDRLCRITAVKSAAPLQAKVFINFIPTSIYSPEFCLRSTVAITDQLGMDPSLLVFEVVETEKVDDLPHLKRILAYYKEQGFAYALDDVGAGFSTMEILAELKPHYMKLDMQYVQGVAHDPAKQSVARTFLQKALEIQAIPLAEGVESREDFEWLKEMGYQLFQGYLFGKPAPLAGSTR